LLDNCEHLIDASAVVVERLLDGCPNLHVLTTTREPLRIPGELIWAVPALAIPDLDTEPDQLSACASVELFAERARAVRPGFTLTPSNARSVAAICRQMEGMPLALELAAARVRTLAVEQILERLDDSIGLLVGGSRTAPTRQQTMRATLDWSYGLLGATEQVVLCGIAVFAETANLEAIQAVCGVGLDLDMLEVLDHLVNRSLVRVDERDGRARYRLLEPVRQYAREKLVAAGTYAELRQRHLAYYLAYAEERGPDSCMGAPRRQPATAELGQAYPDVRLALRWAIESRQAQPGLRLGRSVAYLWQARGYWTEGGGFLEQLLALPGADEPTAAGIVAVLQAGFLAMLRGSFDVAQTYFERGVPLSRGADEAWVRYLGFSNWGIHHLLRGELVRAAELFREARAAARNRLDVGQALNCLAHVAWYQADFVHARELAEEGLRAQVESGDEWAVARVALGMILAGWAIRRQADVS
jgi:predicted ATPase